MDFIKMSLGRTAHEDFLPVQPGQGRLRILIMRRVHAYTTIFTYVTIFSIFKINIFEFNISFRDFASSGSGINSN